MCTPRTPRSIIFVLREAALGDGPTFHRPVGLHDLVLDLNITALISFLETKVVFRTDRGN